ncbi:MAG TPA: hypothetical protein VIF14_16215 [Alphaproteobacteria bacterium]|jgi:hypothetical protein
MRDKRSRGKHEKRPVIDTGSVIARGGTGSVVMRGPVGGAVRRGGGRGARLLVFVAVLFGLYWLAGTFRHELVERVPAAYPILKAIGYELEEPTGYGLRAEVLRTDRYRDETNAAYLLINGVVANSRSERISIPRLRLVISSSRHPEIVVTADPPQATLGPRERTRFEVRHRTGVTLFDVKVRVSFEKK